MSISGVIMNTMMLASKVKQYSDKLDDEPPEQKPQRAPSSTSTTRAPIQAVGPEKPIEEDPVFQEIVGHIEAITRNGIAELDEITTNAIGAHR